LLPSEIEQKPCLQELIEMYDGCFLSCDVGDNLHNISVQNHHTKLVIRPFYWHVIDSLDQDESLPKQANVVILGDSEDDKQFFDNPRYKNLHYGGGFLASSKSVSFTYRLITENEDIGALLVEKRDMACHELGNRYLYGRPDSGGFLDKFGL
jgi:hypothetical protein